MNREILYLGQYQLGSNESVKLNAFNSSFPMGGAVFLFVVSGRQVLKYSSARRSLLQ